jgi:Tol biopolymer transport system component
MDPWGDLRARYRPKEGLDIAPGRWPEVSRIFAAAIEVARADRSHYLNDACRDDPALRAAVDSLLAAHDEAGAFGAIPGLPSIEPAKRLTSGSQLGVFRVEGLLGAGGMGEVYRAHDTKLHRAVALKVLPNFFAHDADRRARFEEEARALAALNHPHVGAIYGLEESGDVAALVLELIEGPTLAERLADGPLPLGDAQRIARQIADGLEAAHDRGIIHRDLKPANIKITAEGSAKILDFGLAKADGTTSPSPTGSPGTRNATVVGTIIGTAGYMSPEQARGLPVDKRTDIWAFGCVLFEMCTGRPPFSGDTISETLAEVVERDPAWHLLPANTPPTVVQILRRCLAKDQKIRLRDIGEARIALTEAGDAEAFDPRVRRRRIKMGAAIVGALGIGGALALLLTPTAPPTTFEFEVPRPAGAILRTHPGQTPFALSPDGSQIALIAWDDAGPVASGRTRIWLRAVSNLQASPLSGTEGATTLFWSPDGTKLAFITGRELKAVDLRAGTILKISDLTFGAFGHGTWGADGVILLGQGAGAEILQVSVAGEEPKVLIRSDSRRNEARVHWPWFLPDGNQFLYTARLTSGEGELRLGRLDGSSRALMSAISNAQWVAPDIVVFARDGALLGQRVDLSSAQLVGGPFTIAQQVDYYATTSRAVFATSPNGVLAYHSGGDLRQLTWVDSTGRELGTLGSKADYYETSGMLSPDDANLLVARRRPGPGTQDIWRLDVVRGHEEQITSGRGSELAPVWMRSGRSFLFSSDSGGHVPGLFMKNLATGEERPLLPPGRQQHPMGVFPDDRTIAYVEALMPGGFRMFTLAINPRGSPSSLGPANDAWDLRLSPNGKAVAYIATERTRRDIYVAPVAATESPVLVAQGVAAPPRWSRDGRRLYFIDGDDRMKSVSVETTPQLEVGTVTSMFAVKRQTTLIDVARDGRLLLLVPHVLAAERPIVVSNTALRSAQQ